ncbi:killer cell lectin-like receptor subfamily B member 1B allele B [Anomaloglossus baeobatrachus]|uniref:killer cell lectin-like receptor subfamily B member 1B allele B n=1 Tax=Anomaloglossus baeobatrachus TaxID=238106 RepID=UPI003F4FABE3
MEAKDERRVWTPSWKGAIITVLLGVIIILLRIIEALVYRRGDYQICESSFSEFERFPNEELCLISINKFTVYHHIDKSRNKLYQELCPYKTDNSPGCLLCPHHLQKHGDQCYHYSDVTGRTWSQSREDCKMMGADLLVIKDRKQQEIIQRSMIQQVEDTYWIGLHRDGDVWRWVDGEHYSHSFFRIKTQESGGCAVMTGSGYYEDHCNSTNRWICVKKAVRI